MLKQSVATATMKEASGATHPDPLVKRGADESLIDEQPLRFNWRWKQRYEASMEYDTPSLLWVEAKKLRAMKADKDSVNIAGRTWTLKIAASGRKTYEAAAKSGKVGVAW
eukprot:316533-Pleurochrysis_carterae.AAC.4